MRLFLPLLPLLLPLACTGKADDPGPSADTDTDTDTDSDTDADTDTDTDADAFHFEEGTWVVVSSTVTANTCGDVESYVPLDPQGTQVTLTATGDRTFTLLVEGDDQPDTCTFAGAGTNYSCDVVTGSDTTPQDYGFDAVINTTSTPSGGFSAPSDDTHDDAVNMDCAGTDCGTMSTIMGVTFPCDLTIENVLQVN